MVQIDHIDTEIEIAPASTAAPAAPQGGSPPPPAPRGRAAGEMLAVLEAELEHYTRMRG